MQKFYTNLSCLNEIIELNGFTNVLIVSNIEILKTQFVNKAINELKAKYGVFTNFTPNPKMTEANEGMEFFKSGNFDAILAIGGGSAMDVAKYIKLNCKTYLIAVPTTAGSGSESTRYAVIYDNGEKQSITSNDIIPEFVIFETKFLETLPEYQKRCTILDALCHSIESYWSVNSTNESKKIAEKAIRLILKNYKQYVNNNSEVYKDIMQASNFAGQAINITQTTAGHALSYKLTSTFNIPHGHAVAVCLSKVWEYLNSNINLCADPRGEKYLSQTLSELSKIISLNDFNNIIKYLNLQSPKISEKSQLDMFVNSVNTQRLGNFPIKLSNERS